MPMGGPAGRHAGAASRRAWPRADAPPSPAVASELRRRPRAGSVAAISVDRRRRAPVRAASSRWPPREPMPPREPLGRDPAGPLAGLATCRRSPRRRRVARRASGRHDAAADGAVAAMPAADGAARADVAQPDPHIPRRRAGTARRSRRRTPAPMAPPPIDAAPPMSAAPAHAPAPVVPLQADKNKPRLVGVAAKKVPGRPLASPSKRGVHLEPLDPKIVKMLDLQSNILERLRAKLDLDKVPMERLHEEELWQRAERATIDLVETLETSGELPKYIDQDALIKETLNEALALGPLEDLFADEKHRRDRDRSPRPRRRRQGRPAARIGQGVLVGRRVRARREAPRPRGRRDDRRDASDRRPAHARRHAAHRRGRAGRGARRVPRAQEAGQRDAAARRTSCRKARCRRGMADFLATCIDRAPQRARVWWPGSGKTDVRRARSRRHRPAGERVVSIEEVARARARRATSGSSSRRAPATARSPRSISRRCSRPRCGCMPDRLVVGEVRGREALPLVQALNSSIDGAVVAMTGEGANAALDPARDARARDPAGGLRQRDSRAGRAGVRDRGPRRPQRRRQLRVHRSRKSPASARPRSRRRSCSSSRTQLHRDRRVPRFYGELEARGIPADQAVFR